MKWNGMVLNGIAHKHWLTHEHTQHTSTPSKGKHKRMETERKPREEQKTTTTKKPRKKKKKKQAKTDNDDDEDDDDEENDCKEKSIMPTNKSHF